MLQELKEKLASWRSDGWLEQCCANLAEQLRIAKAENAELQQEVEALRQDHLLSQSAHSPLLSSLPGPDCLREPKSSRGVRDLGNQTGL